MKKLISSVAAAAVLATAASAAVSSESRGNYLVSPAYFATDGAYQTNFQVFNTSNTKGVIAKVVIREGKCSQELKDFLIFLSPGDVFTADIKNSGGTVTITSTDDSADTGTYGNGGTKTTQASAQLAKGLNLMTGSRFADTTVTMGTTKSKINANSGYIEVFPLVEVDAQAFNSLAGTSKADWEYSDSVGNGKPLDKKFMVAFYDTLTKALYDKGVGYGTRAKNFEDYNATKTNYGTQIASIASNLTYGNDTSIVFSPTNIKNILGVTATTPTPGDYTGVNIDKDLLTGTVTIKNTSSSGGSAMTVPMYALNLSSVLNGIFGERQAETNYARVYGNDYTAANNALGQLVSDLNTTKTYVPYDSGKNSVLNQLFLAKNLSNYKCTFNTYDKDKAVTTATARGITYNYEVRDTEEKIYFVASTEDPFSGIYVNTPDAVPLYRELDQSIISNLTKSAGYSKGWLTMKYANKADLFGYDVNESRTSTASTTYVNKSNSAVILPSYMQIITSGSSNFTNMYIPATD